MLVSHSIFLFIFFLFLFFYFYCFFFFFKQKTAYEIKECDWSSDVCSSDLVVIATIGFWSSKKSLKDSNSYFLAGQNVGWMAVGASLFASNISAEHFIGLAGTGAEIGRAHV